MHPQLDQSRSTLLGRLFFVRVRVCDISDSDESVSEVVAASLGPEIRTCCTEGPINRFI